MFCQLCDDDLCWYRSKAAQVSSTEYWTVALLNNNQNKFRIHLLPTFLKAFFKYSNVTSLLQDMRQETSSTLLGGLVKASSTSWLCRVDEAEKLQFLWEVQAQERTTSEQFRWRQHWQCSSPDAIDKSTKLERVSSLRPVFISPSMLSPGGCRLSTVKIYRLQRKPSAIRLVVIIILVWLVIQSENSLLDNKTCPLSGKVGKTWGGSSLVGVTTKMASI